jgi:hypothetical protein
MKVKLSLLALALAACGGSATKTQDFTANAPTFDKVAIAQNDSDTVAPSMQQDNGGSTALVASDTASPDCHPHLFQRTGEIIGHVNRHFFKMVGHVEDLIKDNPKLAAGQTITWESVKDGIDRKLTITLSADGTTYTFELDLSAGSTTAKVMSGTIATTTAGTVTTTTGNVTFDYTALATVVTTEKSSGQIADSFTIVKDTSKPAPGVKRTASITLTNFHFDDDLHGARNGTYTWEREPGIGGKFQFTDSVILLCPANPSGLYADVTAAARWYVTSDTSVHGRVDAKATGGQFPTGDSWIGLTCAESASVKTAPGEGEWLMKEEDASGNTVTGQMLQVGLTPCDPLFGAVPTLTDNHNDYDFSTPLMFPNEW